jgi:hypothetical protein
VIVKRSEQAMLRSLNEIRGYELRARDGELGKVTDFLFDDRAWVVRYVAARAGSWIAGRDVLISPAKLGTPDWEGQALPVDMTVEQIRNSPGVESQPPVSRRESVDLSRYYIWVPFQVPTGTPIAVKEAKEDETGDGQPDPHLRSADEVKGYKIDATDEEFGHVADFIADTNTWHIRYIVIDTLNWIPGGEVLIAPQWTERVDWEERELHVAMSREKIENCPDYDPHAPVEREYEEVLYDYYGRPVYWGGGEGA